MKKKIEENPKYNIRSRRQMWQTYEHLRKSFEYAKSCWREVRRAEEQEKVKPSLEQKAWNKLMVDNWVTMNDLRRVCRLRFGVEIEKLEVYK